MLTVHVRVNDAATGKPAPVRIRFTGPDGTVYTPFGRLSEFSTQPGEDVGGSVRLGNQTFAYIDGSCEVRLPSGPVRVEAYKGPEYLPLDEQVVLGPGKISLRLNMKRWCDLRTEDWYAGDGRAHELTPHAALLEGAAEGLAIVHLLARERPPSAGRPPACNNLLAFSGSKPALSSPECIVAVNTLNAHPNLGTVALLNSHRVVFPLRFGAPDGLDNWSVADWCDQCHRKSGLVVWPDLPRLSPECPQGEALAALLLGKIDAFEISRLPSSEPDTLRHWYRLLDCGLRVPLVGSSGKESNAEVLGSVRTYARLPRGQDFDLAAWIEAVRTGRTFITNGPLLSLTVEGHKPGTVFETMPGTTVRLRAEARSNVPFERLELLAGGTGGGGGGDIPTTPSLVAAQQANGDRASCVVEVSYPAAASTWIAARCQGTAFAHTSPVYLQVEDAPLRPSASTIAPLLATLDAASDWVLQAARCETDKQRNDLLAVLQAGRENLLAR